MSKSPALATVSATPAVVAGSATPAEVRTLGLPSFASVSTVAITRGDWTQDEAIAAARAAMAKRATFNVKDTSALGYASAAARTMNATKRRTHAGAAYYTGPDVLALLGIDRDGKALTGR